MESAAFTAKTDPQVRSHRLLVKMARHPKPRVSVIIPCFSQARFLPEAVMSVVGQAFDDWEILIVDDGSPDDTAEVAGRLAHEHGPRVRLLRQENGGVARARNAGIALTDGLYVLPLDADDVIEPRMLAETVALLDRDPTVGVAYTDFRYFGTVSREVLVPEFDLDGLCRGNRITATALFRREAWETVGGYDPKLTSGYEDWDFWLGCAERGFLPRHIAGVLFAYRIRAGTRNDMTPAQRRAMAALIMRNHPALYTIRQRARRRLVRVPRNARRRMIPLLARISGSQVPNRAEPW